MVGAPLTIECNARDAATLRTAIEGNTRAKVITATRHNSDGLLETVLLLINTATDIIAITPILISFLVNNKIKKLRLGEAAIENPTREQAATLLRQDIGEIKK